MVKKFLLIAVICAAIPPMSPSLARAHHHGYYGGAALAWGLTGLFVGSALTAAFYRPPVVYAAPVYYQPAYAPPPVYGYAPSVPRGMCRWERYVLDGYGRALLDRYGRPVKEYTLGDCRYPPN